jgi:hypothetical protein
MPALASCCRPRRATEPRDQQVNLSPIIDGFGGAGGRLWRLKKAQSRPATATFTGQEGFQRQEFSMKHLRVSPLFVCAVLCGAAVAHAQQSLDWVPRGIEEIGRGAAIHNDFTLDRSMLQVADGIFDNGDPNEAHAAAKLNGISVHTYRFAAPGMYDPRALLRVHRQYQAEGWKHVVSSQTNGLYNNTGRTDLWVNLRGADVTGVTVLLAGAQNLELIAISCDLSTLDLLHLRGHFGIPRFPSDALPGPGGDRRAPDRQDASPGAAPQQAPSGETPQGEQSMPGDVQPQGAPAGKPSPYPHP